MWSSKTCLEEGLERVQEARVEEKSTEELNYSENQNEITPSEKILCPPDACFFANLIIANANKTGCDPVNEEMKSKR